MAETLPALVGRVGEMSRVGRTLGRNQYIYLSSSGWVVSG